MVYSSAEKTTRLTSRDIFKEDRDEVGGFLEACGEGDQRCQVGTASHEGSRSERTQILDNVRVVEILE